MILPLSWLREFVPSRTAAAELGEKFRMTSSECGGVSDWALKLAGVVAARIVSADPHPHAGRLQVCRIDDGSGTERTVVCGASNARAGLNVLLALPGTVVSPVEGRPHTVTALKLRDVPSDGMLCALEEIGIPYPHAGIWELPDGVSAGASAAEALGLDDPLIDLEITPNRPDLLSIRGLAREVSAFERLRLDMPPVPPLPAPHPGAELRLEARIDASQPARRLCLLALEVPAGAVTPWPIVRRLIQSGVRPLHLVVDVLNYVQLETGQPLHAYDLDRLPHSRHNAGLCIRASKGMGALPALDGRTYAIEAGDPVVAAGDQIVALGGLIGGAEAAVGGDTVRVLLEAATFEPGAVRRLSRRLGLRTEAGTRSEKGTDPELPAAALLRAAALLAESGASPLSGITDTGTEREARLPVSLRFDTLRDLLGAAVSPAECRGIMQRLGFTVSRMTKSGFNCQPPSWREDVTLPEDIIEEIARIWGYARVPNSFLSGPFLPPKPPLRAELRDAVRSAAAASGGVETVSVPFVSAAELERSGIDPADAVPLSNPLAAGSELLAPSHLPLLLAAQAGPNRGRSELTLFELGAIFAGGGESRRFSILLRTAAEPGDAVPRAKRILENAAEAGGAVLSYAPQEGNAVVITSGGRPAGWLELLPASTAAAWKIRVGRILVHGWIDEDALPGSAFRQAEHAELATLRTVTARVAVEQPVGPLLDIVRESSPIIRSVRLVSLYPTAAGKNVSIELALETSSEADLTEAVQLAFTSLNQTS